MNFSEAYSQTWSVSFPRTSGSHAAGQAWSPDGRKRSAYLTLKLPEPIDRPEDIRLPNAFGAHKNPRISRMPFATWEHLIEWCSLNGGPTSFAPIKGTRNEVWGPSDKGETPCMITISANERLASFGACYRPKVDDEFCGMHRKAQERRQERRDEWDRKWAASQANSKAATDWVERINEEFGLNGTSGRGISIEFAAEPLYGKLAEIRTLLDEVYGDDHPWAR